MEDQQLVVAEKKSVSGRLGNAAVGGIKFGLLGTVAGAVIGAVSGGLLFGEAADALVDGANEGLKALPDTATEHINEAAQQTIIEQGTEGAKISSEAANTGKQFATAGGALGGGLTGGLIGAGGGATFGAGAGWADKIKLERAQIQSTGHEV